MKGAVPNDGNSPQPRYFGPEALCRRSDLKTRFAMSSKSWIGNSWISWTRRSRIRKTWIRKTWIERLGAPLIAFALTVALSISTVHAVEDAHKVGVVSFGLFGDQGVFRSEATGAAEVIAGRFETGPIDVQYNSKKGGSATIESLARSLQVAASRLDAEKDVLFLILTSHGSPDGLAIKAGRRTQTLTPSELAEVLAKTRVRHKVVIISACYSGVFIPRLANPDVLVITAADADHPSFGCQDKAKWTYFGDAFFNVTLRQAESLRNAYVAARALVRKRELRENFEPSNPSWQAVQTCSHCLLRALERPAAGAATTRAQRW